jgi:hypothetical protein
MLRSIIILPLLLVGLAVYQQQRKARICLVAPPCWVMNDQGVFVPESPLKRDPGVLPRNKDDKK